MDNRSIAFQRTVPSYSSFEQFANRKNSGVVQQASDA
jgi:hypothetical protein